MVKQAFKLSNVSCSSCVIHLEGLEDNLNGVSCVDVNYKQQTMTVEYEPDSIALEQICSAVKDLGYGAEPTEAIKEKGSIWNKYLRS
jgi:copper chaperone CopZ